jgi:hypothetical protein
MGAGPLRGQQGQRAQDLFEASKAKGRRSRREQHDRRPPAYPITLVLVVVRKTKTPKILIIKIIINPNTTHTRTTYGNISSRKYCKKGCKIRI